MHTGRPQRRAGLDIWLRTDERIEAFACKMFLVLGGFAMHSVGVGMIGKLLIAVGSRACGRR